MYLCPAGGCSTCGAPDDSGQEGGGCFGGDCETTDVNAAYEAFEKLPVSALLVRAETLIASNSVNEEQGELLFNVLAHHTKHGIILKEFHKALGMKLANGVAANLRPLVDSFEQFGPEVFVWLCTSLSKLEIVGMFELRAWSTQT